MATLSEVVKKYKKEGDSNLSALSKGGAEKLKEKIDPRRFLFSKGGLMTTLFPSLKPFQAKGVGGKSELLSSGSDISSLQPSLDLIAGNTEITAKNSVVFPMMARDMNLMKLNILKLVKLMGGKANRDKTDIFWSDAAAREASYEKQFEKSKGKREEVKPTKIEVAGKKTTVADIIEGVVGGELLAKFLPSMVKSAAGFLFGPVGLGIMMGAGLMAVLGTLISRAKEEDVEQLNKGIVDSGDVSSPGRTIMETVESTSDIERRKQNLLADRSSGEKSLLFWKDPQMQKDYLQKIGFDETTGLTAKEREAGFTGIDEKGKPIVKSTSPTQVSTSAPGKSSSPTPLSGESFEKMAVQLIKKEEGLPKDGKAYKDAGGVSIGYGHFITGPEQQQGFIQAGDERIPLAPNIMDTKLSKDQAEKLLMSDLPKYIESAKRPLGEAWDKLNDQQKATMISYAYNTGSTASLVKAGLKDAIMSGNMDLASKIISEKGIKTSQGQLNTALVKRRDVEAQLFAGEPSQKGQAIQTASTQVAESKMAAMTPAASSTNVVDNSVKTTTAGTSTPSKPSSAYDRDIVEAIVGSSYSTA